MIWIAAAAAASATCSTPPGAGADASTQHDAYARRSVEIVALAAVNDDARLAKLIAPKAEFSLGAGDVGRPLGAGLNGARSIANEMKAATYSYNGWDYMLMRRDPCGPQDVEVEFVSSDGTRAAKVKFHYEGGLLRSAKGWSRSRSSGPVVAEAR